MRSLSVLLGIMAVANAGCSGAPSKRVDWRVATAQLEARLSGAQTDRAQVPRLANPTDAALLRSVFDLDAIWGMAEQDFPAISERCNPVRSIGRHYARLSAGPGGPDYRDEMALGGAAFFLCVARETHAVERFTAGLPATERTPFRRAQALEAGQRIAGLLIATIGIWGEADGANGRLMQDAVVKAAPILSAALPLAQRAMVHDAIDRKLPKLNARDRATLTALSRAFQGATCAAVCTLTS